VVALTAMHKPSFAARLLALLATILFRLLRMTWRVRVIGEPPPGAGLLAFWHGDQVALAAAPASDPLTVLVSRSRDGDLAARLVQTLGFDAIRGSTSRGAVSGALALARRLLQGARVAVAVDGPRGPRHRAADGLLRLARSAGAPVIPVVASTRRGFSLRSWDRLVIPAPFTKIYVFFGAAIDHDADAANEKGGRIQAELDALWSSAQQLTAARDR